MKLTIVGCSGTFPGPESPCSSYLLEHDGFRMLVDAGNGSTGVLQRTCGLLDLDAIVISHLHGDHFLDLVTYTYARRYHPSGLRPPIPVYGPADTEAHVAGAFGRPVPELLGAVYDFRSIAGASRVEVGPFTIDVALMNHPVETYGMRIAAGGRTLAYSADSGVSDELVKLAREVDLFLCEASYLDGDDNPPNIHLTGREAGEHATRAEVGRLLLTHLVPWGDQARTLGEATAAFAGDVSVARTCAVYDV
jgi:ribonuclease BN (tRNA processing enzyme)